MHLTHFGFCLSSHTCLLSNVRNGIFLRWIDICHPHGQTGRFDRNSEKEELRGSGWSISGPGDLSSRWLPSCLLQHTVPCAECTTKIVLPWSLGEGQWKIRFCSPVGIFITSSQRHTAAWLIAYCCCLIPTILGQGLYIFSRLCSWPWPRAGWWACWKLTKADPSLFGNKNNTISSHLFSALLWV